MNGGCQHRMRDMQDHEHLSPSTRGVIDHVQRLIEDGSLQPGCRVPPEREFAKNLKINRGSVRIGIGYLVGMGVMEVRRGVGTFLVNGHPKRDGRNLDLLGRPHGFGSEEMHEILFIIESATAVLASKRARAEHHQSMAEDIAEMYASAECPESFLKYQMHFHQVMANAAGNPVLAASLESLSAVLISQKITDRQSAEERRNLAFVHRGLYHAIRNRRADEARQRVETLFAPEHQAASGNQSQYGRCASQGCAS